MTHPDGQMADVVASLTTQQDALADLVRDLDAAALSTASRCEGWSLADVLLHLAQTNELAVASVEGRFSEAVDAGPDISGVSNVDEWAGAAVEAERGTDPVVTRDRWLASASAQAAAFAAADPGARVWWVAGDLAARTLATTRLSETWIHAEDVAHGLGTSIPAGDHLWHIARLAHRTLPYAFAGAGLELSGPVVFELTSPSGGQWTLGEPEGSRPATVVRGPAVELCEVAGQRRPAGDTSLRAEGPDAAAVLELVRTFA